MNVRAHVLPDEDERCTPCTGPSAGSGIYVFLVCSFSFLLFLLFLLFMFLVIFLFFKNKLCCSSVFLVKQTQFVVFSLFTNHVLWKPIPQNTLETFSLFLFVYFLVRFFFFVFVLMFVCFVFMFVCFLFCRFRCIFRFLFGCSVFILMF